MVDLVPKDAGKFSASNLTDALLIGGIKVIEERALAQFIGNGTVKSGAIKLVAGGIISGGMKNKSGNLVSSAFAIDGIEDLVNGILNAATGISQTNTAEGMW